MTPHALSQTEVRQLIKDLPPIRPDCFWNANRIQLRNYILNHNLEHFLQFPVIAHTMNVGTTLLQYEEIALRDEIEAEFSEDEWGNYFHQRHHFSFYRDNSKKEVLGKKELNVVEIGGGFGMMRAFFHYWSADKHYTIVDLPEFCILQQWWLENRDIFGTEWMSLDDFVWTDRRWDLMIACWSLSEIEQRPSQEFFDKADDYLIAYQRHHDGLPFSNVDWFNRFKEAVPRRWVEEEISFLPGNLYLVGTA